MNETVQKKVEKALDEIRPNIQADGGDVKLISVDNGVVKVKLQGHCVGCPMSALTLKQGIESHIKQRVPDITKVENIS